MLTPVVATKSIASACLPSKPKPMWAHVREATSYTSELTHIPILKAKALQNGHSRRARNDRARATYGAFGRKLSHRWGADQGSRRWRGPQNGGRNPPLSPQMQKTAAMNSKLDRTWRNAIAFLRRPPPGPDRWAPLRLRSPHRACMPSTG
jgi:hypothetical protein